MWGSGGESESDRSVRVIGVCGRAESAFSLSRQVCV